MHLQKLDLKVFNIETSTSLGSLHKYEGAAEFMGALGSRHPLISALEEENFLFRFSLFYETNSIVLCRYFIITILYVVGWTWPALLSRRTRRGGPS